MTEIDRVALAEQRLQALLAESLGLSIASVSDGFYRSILSQLKLAPDTDPVLWLDGARQDPERLLQIHELAVVPETWFFRDEQAFDFVAATMRAVVARGQRPVRVLSAPCSTGEEPYTVALCAKMAGLSPADFEIVALDVSQQAIQFAVAGRYQPRSFRRKNIPAAMQIAADRSLCVPAEIRRSVQFQRANLVTGAGLRRIQGKFHIVLCRNLLIYLHADARQQVFGRIAERLEDQGVVVVGHAESALAQQHGYESLGQPAAFAFRPATRLPVVNRQAMTAAARASQPTPRAVSSLRPRHSVQHRAEPAAAETPDLERIRELADRGETRAAVQLCQQFLQQMPASADGHFLHATLLESCGDRRAAESALNCALYLEPGRQDALMLLAALLGRRGESGRAARLRAQAELAGQERGQ